MGTPPLSNVQGDILLDGLPKRNESFFLFTIPDDQVQAFCQSLPKLSEHIVDSEHTKAIRAEIAKAKAGGKDGDTINTVGACIAFSRRGLDKVSGRAPDLAPRPYFIAEMLTATFLDGHFFEDAQNRQHG